MKGCASRGLSRRIPTSQGGCSHGYWSVYLDQCSQGLVGVFAPIALLQGQPWWWLGPCTGPAVAQAHTPGQGSSVHTHPVKSRFLTCQVKYTRLTRFFRPFGSQNILPNNFWWLCSHSKAGNTNHNIHMRSWICLPCWDVRTHPLEAKTTCLSCSQISDPLGLGVIVTHKQKTITRNHSVFLSKAGTLWKWYFTRLSCGLRRPNS